MAIAAVTDNLLCLIINNAKIKDINNSKKKDLHKMAHRGTS
jgi:hypothetical protein